MFTASWTELLLNSERMTDLAVIFLESFDINGNNDVVTDLMIFNGSVFVNVITTTGRIHNRIGNDLSSRIQPGLNRTTGAIDDLTGKEQTGKVSTRIKRDVMISV